MKQADSDAKYECLLNYIRSLKASVMSVTGENDVGIYLDPQIRILNDILRYADNLE